MSVVCISWERHVFMVRRGYRITGSGIACLSIDWDGKCPAIAAWCGLE